jgi:AAT family amino acid transporter
MPFNAVLFWALLFVVWSGFNLELAGFTRLPQPWRGLAVTAATVAFAVSVTWSLAVGMGHFFPDLAASREGGAGYFTGALFVLFGFSTYVVAVVNWSHWPWTDLGLRQPLVGLCEIAFLLLPTALLWITLGVPAVADGPSPLMSVDTLLGWYYSIIVAIVLTGLTLDNWPWRLAGSRALVAVVSLLGNVVLGTVLYFALRGVSEVLIGADTVGQLGPAIDQFPAQLGVCWVAWMIVWGNIFGNRPGSLGLSGDLAARVTITFALGVGTFVLYYRVLAERLLHEPSVAGSLSGNALGFLDWFALVALLYVVGFESWPLRPAAAPSPTPAPEHIPSVTTPTQEVLS